MLSNREYRILKHNVDVWRKNFEPGTQHPYQQMDLTGPDLDFVHLATGMGVEAIRVEKADDIASVVAKAVATNGPISSRSLSKANADGCGSGLQTFLRPKVTETGGGA